MKLLINNFVVALLIVFLGAPKLLDAQGFYNRYEYRRKRHQITFGAGASACLTDVGGSDFDQSEFDNDGLKNTFRSIYDLDLAKTKYAASFSYIYQIASSVTLRANLSAAEISGDDALTAEYFRNNRRLNFNTFLAEASFISEYILIHERTGNRYNLRSPAGKFLGAKTPLGIGLYVFAGVGGVYFEPSGYDRFIDEYGTVIGSGKKYKLRELRTEGQGTSIDTVRKLGQTYNPVAICIPLGIGIKKAFNGNNGIKLEFGYRFTNTDYLDDVSSKYYDWSSNGGSEAQIAMSGTNTGGKYEWLGMAPSDGNGGWIYPPGSTPLPWIGGGNVYYTDQIHHTHPGNPRGNPENDDGYMFLTISAYKKFNNAAKSYRTINMHQKRKIKASF